MKKFRADIHIHTVLSPCGDLEMSPDNIVKKAKEKKLNIIGITDHNSLKQCSVIKNIAKQYGIYTLTGVEITTKEEVHCLAFFDKNEEILKFQNYIDKYLPDIKNNTDIFGYQVVVDKDNNIIESVDKLLISAIDQSIEQIEKKVHSLNGIFIPAHINKSKFSIISQLGFIPKTLIIDALELSKHISKKDFIEKFEYLKNYTFIQNSDSHYIDNIADVVTIYKMNEISFDEIKKALHNIDGREVIVN
ncbi:MAG: PHP domain-containing protein [Bacteroidales bacterium]|nr:PHP domain-containing protein [Bacteroidales bacterium]